jgi:hypothetical protein
LERNENEPNTEMKFESISIDFSGWASVCGAFAVYYAVLAAFTAVLFAVALSVAHSGGDPRHPCPFPELALTNCYAFCGGPPQLLGAFEAAANNSLLRAEAAQRITSWIAGRYWFVWNDSSYPLFDGLNVTNEFYRKLQCCKLKDGVPLTQANIDDGANWDVHFNENECSSWIDDARRRVAD